MRCNEEFGRELTVCSPLRCFSISNPYSQGRLKSVKQELSVTAASARAERQDALQRLQELETEVARLASAVSLFTKSSTST